MINALVTILPFFAYPHFVQEKQFNENGELKPEKRHGRRLLHPNLPVLVRLKRAAQHPLGHADHRLRFLSIAAFLLFNSVLSYLSDSYPDYAASVLAGNDFMRSSFRRGVPALCVCDVQTSGRELGE